MAHNLAYDERMKEYRMAFAGDREAIWHGLGQQIAADAGIDEWLQAGHLDWEVEKVPAVTMDGKRILSYCATVRKDTGDVLGLVTDTYRCFQNREAFEWLKAFDQVRFDTCGALGNGAQVWVMGVDEGATISVRGEEVVARILLHFSHDRSLMIGGGLTPTRVVCQNTLRASMRNLSADFGITHVGDVKERMKQAAKAIDQARSYGRALQEYGTALADTKISREDAAAFFGELLPIPEGAKKGTALPIEVKRDVLMELFFDGAGNRGESAWDALNAATEFADHGYRYIDTERNTKAESRFRSSMWGRAREFKQRAWDVGIEMFEIEANHPELAGLVGAAR